jgi:uncharacterized membrane protein
MLYERRHEISRLEAFSDAAFAFALTLLVVSLDVRKSYDELIRTMRGFPSFACCFALLVWIWCEHKVNIFAGHHLVSALVGCIALPVATVAPVRYAPLSPSCFALMGPAHWTFNALSAKRRRTTRAS